MTWISLVCLLALSSSAFARSVTYGSYGGVQAPQVSSMNLVRDFSNQQQQSFVPQSSYGQQQQQQQQPQQQQEDQTNQPEIQPIQSGYGQQYGAQQMIRKPTVQLDQSYNRIQLPAQRSFASPAQLLHEQKQKLQQLIQESTVLTEADILCRGKAPETVIPLDNGRRFVVCIDESKGNEQTCPRGLLFHPETARCERKLGPIENPCSSQPCLNNGQCVQTDVTSYKCQCAQGFDGEHCELDATVCQTQYPCGQSQDAKCQSFRYGAALQHICILQGGRAYGLTASQAQQSPCVGVDGTFPLAFSDKGFIMCSGELMYVESCPGGTVWDDLNKACVWPDMQGLSFEDQTPKVQAYGASSYNTVPRTLPTQYGAQIQQQQLDIPMKPVHSYGQSQIKSFTQPKLIQQQDDVQSYGQAQIKPFTQPKLMQQQDEVQSYGKIQLPVQQEQIRQQQSFGGYQQTIPKTSFQQPIQRDFLRAPQQSGY